MDVAIKVLNDEYRKNRKLVESLRGEVRISRALRHPAICPIHELYEGPEGFGIVMDLLEGCDLKTWLRTNEKSLLESLPDRVALLAGILDGLEVVRECQVVGEGNMIGWVLPRH